jgi:acetyl esterase
MTKPRHDPEFPQALLDLLPTVTDFGDPAALTEMRENGLEKWIPAPDRDDVDLEDRSVPGPDDAPDVRIRIYRPRTDTPVRAAVYEIHGGGFMMGSIAMMDAWSMEVAAALDVVVVSVEYRLAPEHPFPAGVEDCYAGLSWLAANAETLGVDRARIATAGQSAGGGLAAATALMARDRGGAPLCFQLLEIPELDDRLDTPSMLAFVDTPLWNRPNAVWSWRYYLGPDHRGEVSPYAAPARAEDLSGLPPAFVSTMEFDPLRDEGIHYAQRLMQAGVSVELHNYPGTFHGSAIFTHADVSKRITRDAMGALERALRG